MAKQKTGRERENRRSQGAGKEERMECQKTGGEEGIWNGKRERENGIE